jgi:hypothetical protein
VSKGRAGLTEDMVLEHMRSGAQLRLMHCWGRGSQYFVCPPGKEVRKAAAERILRHPDIRVYDDGLFKDSPQSWGLALPEGQP